MIQVRPWLAIGKYRETTDLNLLKHFQVGAMLQLADAVPQPGIASLYLAVEDGVPLPREILRRGVDFIRMRKADGHKVLVACGAGISRSVTFSIAALREEENLSLFDAYSQILDVHPDAFPHHALWESLRSYYGDDMTYEAVWDELFKRQKGK